MIVLRKSLSVEKGQQKLFEEYRYFFYITNDRESSAEQIVFLANDRCDQENLIEQLKNGCGRCAIRWTTCTATGPTCDEQPAWTLKSWCGLLLPVTAGAPAAKHRQQKHSIVKMEFKRL